MKRWKILRIRGWFVLLMILYLFTPFFKEQAIGQTVRRRALLVGVTTYEDTRWNNLKFPASDAKAIAQALTDQQVGGWKTEDIKILCDANATRANFEKELLPLLKASKKGDFVLVYFSGHGFVADKHTYLVVHDTKENQSETGIDLNILRFWLSTYGEGATKLIILDACYAGGIVYATKGGSDIFQGINSIFSQQSGGLGFITSSGAGETSREGTTQGLFTELFLKGLREAQGFGPYVTYSDVWSYVRNNIQDQTPQQGGDIPTNIPLAIRKGEQSIAAVTSIPYNDLKNIELEFWKSIKESKNSEDYQAYLNKYPNGEYASLARNRLHQLQEQVMPPTATPRISSGDSNIVSSNTRYTKNSNGIIYDSKTGLEWYTGPDKPTTWDAAKQFVDSLSADGGGWRLPTLDELEALYEKGASIQNTNPIFGTFYTASDCNGCKKEWLWVWSTEKDSSSAWGFGFDGGGRSWGGREGSYTGRVFAVRSRRR